MAGGKIIITTGTAPDTPSAGKIAVYSKADKNLYIKDDTGTETILEGTTPILSTKGDILGYDTSETRIGVGTDGYVLAADSSEPTGLKWVEAAAGGGAVDSVAGKTGVVTLDKADITDFVESDYATGAEGDLATSALQSGDVGLGTLDVDLSDLNKLSDSMALDSPSVTVISNVLVINLLLEKSGGGGDIRFKFSDGIHIHDCTPAASALLVSGTDTVPQINYVYILQSNKTLTVNQTGFPAAEHAPIATVYCQSAVSVNTDGCFKVHQWTDHAAGGDGQGHLAHLNAWIRNQAASWVGGCALTPTVGSGVFDIAITSGSIYQLHPHTMPAFDTSVSDHVYIVNDPTTAFLRGTDLTQSFVSQDTDGVALGANGTAHYNLVVWGVVSEETGDCQIMINLPNGSYANNAESNAIDDVDGTAIYTIPKDFKGTGFLISRLTVNGLSGTYTVVAQADLRGLYPQVSAGGSTGGGGSASPLTTKGDVYVYGTEDTRLAIGTNDQVLTADSTNALGVTWTTPIAAPVDTVAGRTGDVVIVKADIADFGSYATTAQGTLADSALQQNDDISELFNNTGYITSASQPGDNISTFTNDSGYITSAPVTSVNGDVGVVVLDKTSVGLANVDNTSDLSKPISTLTQAEIDTKAETVHTHTKANITDFVETDYATGAEGDLATSALQDITGESIEDLSNVVLTAPATTEALVYNGTNWVNDTVIGATPLTTKGDILAYSTADERLPVGIAGQVLTVDLGEATGVKWAQPATGATGLATYNGGSITGGQNGTMTGGSIA